MIIEGPGHMALNQIEANMKIQQTISSGRAVLCAGAPCYRYCSGADDHITAAIGGAIAAANGASFLCYVTPAEHLRLPDVDDVRRRDHCFQDRLLMPPTLPKGSKAADWDRQMSTARKNLDWEEMFRLCHRSGKKPDATVAQAKPEKEDTCSMCGNFCGCNRI